MWCFDVGACLGLAGRGGDADGSDGAGRLLIWWLEGRNRAGQWLRCSWLAVSIRKEEGKEGWVDLFSRNLLMVILVGC